jgi:hypothetical protein
MLDATTTAAAAATNYSCRRHRNPQQPWPLPSRTTCRRTIDKQTSRPINTQSRCGNSSTRPINPSPSITLPPSPPSPPPSPPPVPPPSFMSFLTGCRLCNVTRSGSADQGGPHDQVLRRCSVETHFDQPEIERQTSPALQNNITS